MRIAAKQMQSVENEECGRKCRVVWKMRSVVNEKCGRKCRVKNAEIAKSGKRGI
ncbi:unnamed protein product, partial [Porites evermanni]